jgi:hypothetical protein
VATPEVVNSKTEKVLAAQRFDVPIITLELFQMIFERDDFDIADIKAWKEGWLYDPGVNKIKEPTGGEVSFRGDLEE